MIRSGSGSFRILPTRTFRTRIGTCQNVPGIRSTLFIHAFSLKETITGSRAWRSVRTPAWRTSSSSCTPTSANRTSKLDPGKYSFTLLYYIMQCCGSMTFWGGSADPCLWLMDPDSDPDPDIFVIDLPKMPTKTSFFKTFLAYYFLKIHVHHFQR